MSIGHPAHRFGYKLYQINKFTQVRTIEPKILGKKILQPQSYLSTIIITKVDGYRIQRFQIRSPRHTKTTNEATLAN